MKRALLVICLMMTVIVMMPQSLTVKVPPHVQCGENFRLTYTVNSQNASDFRVGNIPEELEIITGPYTSSQSSFQMVNGHTSSSSSVTYTFILCANKNGSFTIPPAQVKVNGHTIASAPAKVSVSGSAATMGSAPKMHDEDADRPQMKSAGTPISGSDLFIKVNANKRRVHEQEPVLLTYKVYSLVDLTQLEGKMPDLTGFHTQEVPLPQQKSFHIETINGKNYRCATWSQYVMYPQMTGMLQIPSITFNGTIVQQNKNVDPFEAFFNGGSGYVEVKRSIVAPGLTIQVDPLPTRPDNFSGGVGKFNISAQLNSNEVRANDPVTIRVVISGVGNLKLIKQPVVSFPKDFDKYDPKVTDKTRLSASGVEGNMVYDFLAVPRNKGKYNIPAVEFTYFDTESNSYKTIKSQSFSLNVSEGVTSSSSSVNYMDDNNQDIRPIKTGNATRNGVDQLFFGSTAYLLLLTSFIVAFVILLVVFRRRAIANADIVKRRGKNANKVATKRLRYANKLMIQNRQDEFYDEVLRALWGYVGDKLNIPVTELTHDNISGKLALQQVDEQTIDKFIQALDECEFERYAPGDATGNMNKTFQMAMTAIMQIEESMKTKQKNTPFRTATFLLLVMASLAATAQNPTKEKADAEYSKGNYQQAAQVYEALLKQGPSVSLYYNLGNAYYRLDNITQSVLAYERALRLDPSDRDVRFNLEKARMKTIDKMTPPSEMFFFVWFRDLVRLFSADGWAWLSILSILSALLLTLLYLFAPNILLRKAGFFGACIFLVFFLASFVFAFQLRRAMSQHTGAVVVAPSATIRKTPSSSGTETGVVHEGTRMDITDDTMRDWKAVRLLDGRQGWIQTSKIEAI